MQYDQDKVFTYLDALRDSGITNMLGASPYLQRDLFMDRHEAKKWLRSWIEYQQKQVELINHLRGV